ncbi:hypothetical protein CEXT_310491 [Caerostris extrusa]|uniref:Uncharacterized protein n=1 Tax=Caerostris extrusa TaxID=172846 RepID=A0AAV4UZ94_CAEEX|nr:hypothetical protein CEXT_310491 [Caerostris extrusa]
MGFPEVTINKRKLLSSQLLRIASVNCRRSKQYSGDYLFQTLAKNAEIQIKLNNGALGKTMIYKLHLPYRLHHLLFVVILLLVSGVIEIAESMCGTPGLSPFLWLQRRR